MWALLLVAILVAFMLLKYRETFVVKYGNPFDGEDLLSFDSDAKGSRLFGTTPDTCPLDRPELEAGLCYERCDEGYHGNGPVCWANTEDRGIGRLPRYKSCSEMGLGPDYRDDPLTCWKDLKCTSECTSSKRDLFGNCYAWHLKVRCSGPDLKGKQAVCPGPTWAGNTDEHTEFVAGLCYKKCPADKPNMVPGAPTSCMKGERGLSYGRGAGTVPPIFAFGG